MPAQALLLLVPEGLGLLAGGAEALFGESLPTGVRDFLDTLDELSLINTALEGLGVMPSQPAETDVWKVARPMVSSAVWQSPLRAPSRVWLVRPSLAKPRQRLVKPLA